MSKKLLFGLAIVLLLAGTVAFASAQSFATRTNSISTATYQRRPNFESYYSQAQINQIWPILGDDAGECFPRQDLQLGVPPVGCQPAVVRSDLLADQDVPVFCQLDSVKINPLIDITRVRNMVFRGERPPEVLDFGFHPARAALGMFNNNNNLIGSPVINNAGYVIVVLRRQPIESELPESINMTLTAQVDYIAGNAYGVGRSEFILEQVSDEDWENEKTKQSFWNGRYFVRLVGGDENFADVALYWGDRRISTTRIARGETSREIFMPGLYCQAGLQVRYSDFVSAERKARIEVSSGGEVDAFDVYEGTRFLDDRCTVNRININTFDGETGEVSVRCEGQEFELALKPRGEWELGKGKVLKIGTVDARLIDDEYRFTVVNNDTNVSEKTYRFDADETLYGFIDGAEERLLTRSNLYHESFTNEAEKRAIKLVRDELIKYMRELERGEVVLDKSDGEKHFDSAINTYERVIDGYAQEAGGVHGKRAFENAIDLARQYENDVVRARLMRSYLETYEQGENTQAYLSELTRLDEIDFSAASEMVDFSDKPRVVSLVGLTRPKNAATADLDFDGRPVTLRQDILVAFTLDGGILEGDIADLMAEDTNNKIRGQIRLENVGVSSAELSAFCVQSNQTGSRVISTRRQRFNLQENAERGTEICGSLVRLRDVKSERVWKVDILPRARGTVTETNFTVNIGIEKRAIELTPDKVRSKIDNLNDTIEQWNSLNEKLGNVVSGLKTACFATSGILTFKNFLTGLNGETIARQEVMNGPGGWKERCADEGISLDACFSKYSSEIDAEVAARNGAQNSVNSVILGIQNDAECVNPGNGVFGKSVDNKCVNRKLAERIVSEYGSESVTPGDNDWQGTTGAVSVSTLLGGENADQMSSDQLRTLYSNLKERELAGGNLPEDYANRLSGSNGLIVDQVENNLVLQEAINNANADRTKGIAAAFYGDEKIKAADVVRIGSSARTNYAPALGLANNVTHTATYVKDGKKYILGLREEDPTKKYYSTQSAMIEGGGAVSGAEFVNLTQSIGTIRSVSTLTYNNKMIETDTVVRYYETEPYRGMPAFVPVDSDKGWYAATRQSVPIFGGVGAFDKSGRVTSFWLCNVGENGRAEFNSGVGDDACQLINTNTGQPIGSFPGLSSSEASSLVTKATQCVEQAARQYGNTNVNVCGATRKVGSPMADITDSHCADFMSPKDCKLLFNVCDPVICPPSRCNLGGTFHVPNVVQTGIIGSTFLCLPNINEGIVMPVCLTGIHAGIDGLISIMENYRDCLSENLETGETVGICDQIYSIYLCEFFWNQVAPFVNVIVPKLIELAYGQGVRGGAEYLSVMSAWQNMENSLNYFTQSYAVNAVNAFQVKNVQEVGTQFCKGFVSAKGPTAFETLVEPESPPQFHAWFSSKEFTSATVPATSQYKVFYHIYAGNDQGTTFSVYLRSPPDSSFYNIPPTVGVDNGFIPPGEYASQTLDFTAPEGYQELCVRINNDEHCDFKQVSSSFAVNYLKDEYIKGELQNSNIASEQECISGERSPATLLNPNIQAGIEETISPAIYNRGVVRICSTGNPGLGTDPGRFVRVGHCGKQQIGCWLDSQSVDRALSDGNFGARNETLSVLNNITNDYLDNEQGFVSRGEAAGQLNGMEGALQRLTESFDNKEDISSGANTLLDSIGKYEDRIFYNSQKGHLLVIRGDVYRLLALQEKGKEDAAKRATGGVQQPCIDSLDCDEEGFVAGTFVLERMMQAADLVAMGRVKVVPELL